MDSWLVVAPLTTLHVDVVPLDDLFRRAREQPEHFYLDRCFTQENWGGSPLYPSPIQVVTGRATADISHDELLATMDRQRLRSCTPQEGMCLILNQGGALVPDIDYILPGKTFEESILNTMVMHVYREQTGHVNVHTATTRGIWHAEGGYLFLLAPQESAF